MRQRAFEHGPVQEEERGECLVLRGRAHVVIGGEPREEPAHVCRPKIARVARSAEDDEAPNPEEVGVFGPRAEVSEAAGAAHLVEESRWRLQVGVWHARARANGVPAVFR